MTPKVARTVLYGFGAKRTGILFFSWIKLPRRLQIFHMLQLSFDLRRHAFIKPGGLALAWTIFKGHQFFLSPLKLVDPVMNGKGSINHLTAPFCSHKAVAATPANWHIPSSVNLQVVVIRTSNLCSEVNTHYYLTRIAATKSLASNNCLL